MLSAAAASAATRFETLVASLDVLRAKIRPSQVISLPSFAISTSTGPVRRYLAPTNLIASTSNSGPLTTSRDSDGAAVRPKERENRATATVLPRASRVTIVGVIDSKETADDFLFPVDPLSTSVSIALSYQTGPIKSQTLVLSTALPSQAASPVPSSALTALGIPTGYIGITVSRGGDGGQLPSPADTSSEIQSADTQTEDREPIRASSTDSAGTWTGVPDDEERASGDAPVGAASTFEAIFYTLVIEQATGLASPGPALATRSAVGPATIHDGHFERLISGRVGAGTGPVSLGLIVNRAAAFDVLVVSVGAGDGVSGALPLRASGPLAGAMSEEPVSRTVDLRDALALELAWYLLDEGILSQDADDLSAGSPIALPLLLTANDQPDATQNKTESMSLRVADWPPASSEFNGGEARLGQHCVLIDNGGASASDGATDWTPNGEGVEPSATESVEKQETDTQRTQFVRAVVTMGWALAFTFLLPDLSAFFMSRTDKSRFKRSKVLLSLGRGRQPKPEN